MKTSRHAYEISARAKHFHRASSETLEYSFCYGSALAALGRLAREATAKPHVRSAALP